MAEIISASHDMVLCFVREKQKSSKKEKISIKSDQMRFPSFEKIFSYAISVKKTEEFLDRLTSSFEHIKEHIQTRSPRTFSNAICHGICRYYRKCRGIYLETQSGTQRTA